ncbi:MAG: hypothetical protein SPL41_08545 [Succinivibrionaceae bacterium]|nr:hypothetical protein [Succinivibrionaceae bacterium]
MSATKNFSSDLQRSLIQSKNLAPAIAAISLLISRSVSMSSLGPFGIMSVFMRKSKPHDASFAGR